MKNTALHRASCLTILGVAILMALTANPVPARADDTAPRLKDGTVVVVARTGALTAAIDQLVGEVDQPAWVGYAVAGKPGVRICSGVWEGKHNVGELERSDEGLSVSNDDDDDEMHVDRRLLILMRVSHDRIGRLRVYTDDCPLDAGSRTLHWLGEVSTDESIGFLEHFISGKELTESQRDELESKAVSAIAWHDDPAGLDALERLYRKSDDDELRSELVFWMGQSGGERAVAFLRGALHEDRSSDVREQIIFAISQDDSPLAVDALIEIARQDPDSELREKALFWLSQKAGDKVGNKAAKALHEAALDDPDLDVKEHAVFALSQLPPDQGIPLLIDVARHNPHPKIRENAIFWLGQSDDPRVLTFFEEILAK